MTSSIPLSLPETMVPSGTPAGPGDPLPGAARSVPDFAGLLDGPVPDATPAPIPAVLVTTDVPGVAAVLLPAEVPWVGIPAGVAAAPLASASVARRFVPAQGRVERAGETPAVSEIATVDLPVTPTRAEQEEAMAMLSALFPTMPVPPVALAPTPISGSTPAPGPTPAPVPAGAEPAAPSAPGGLPQAKELAPAKTEMLPPAPGISNATLPPNIPVAGRERPTGRSGQPASVPVTRMMMNRADPTDPTDRSDAPVGSATIGAPQAPAQPAVFSARRDARALPETSPLTVGSDAPETASPRIPLAAAPASPAPVSPAIEPAAPAGAAAVLVEAPVPAEPPAEIAATPAPDCTVVEASVVRSDGVRLARRTAVIAAGTTGRAFVEEKSAGATAVNAVLPVREKNSAGKKVLSASGQQLAENAPEDGTTAANGGVTMNPLSPLASDAPAQRPGAETKLAEAVSIPATPEAAALAAPRVISTVLEVVEAQEASKLRPVPAVHLRMQVAGETVGIKVELRDNTVQTHFTTVSPELREALTREWQAARAGTPEGAPRLLDPVFNSNPDRGGSSSHGQDTASQQQQQARTWGLPWQQSASPSSRRPRPAAAPESTPAAGDALDARLLSAVA